MNKILDFGILESKLSDVDVSMYNFKKTDGDFEQISENFDDVEFCIGELSDVLKEIIEYLKEHDS